MLNLIFEEVEKIIEALLFVSTPTFGWIPFLSKIFFTFLQ